MKLTKYTHATVVLEKDGTTLVLDPGTFTPEAGELLKDATAVLITHDHFDHFDVDAIAPALQARPELLIYGPEELGKSLPEDVAGQFRAVRAGDSLTLGSFEVTAFGENHAIIWGEFPQTQNVAFLIDGKVYHPGDSYFVPGVEVETLLLPTSGPWTSFAQGVDFVRAIGAKRAIQIHEAMLSELGQQGAARMLGTDGFTETPVEILKSGESTEV